MTNPDLAWQLEQRRLITETLQAYCFYVDRNDPAGLVANVFAPEGSFMLGSNRAVSGPDNLARMFAKTLASFSATSHHLSNVSIELVDDDHATSTAYIYAWHRTAVEGRRVEIWGRYFDEHVRTAAGWRIAVRRLGCAGADGWESVPFEMIERLANPKDTPSPEITRLAAR